MVAVVELYLLRGVPHSSRGTEPIFLENVHFEFGRHLTCEAVISYPALSKVLQWPRLPCSWSCALIFRNQEADHGLFDVWTPQELHQDPDLFISRVSATLSLRPSISMEYLFLTPTGTAHTTVAPPVVALKRFYSMHHRRGMKDVMSFASQPCRQLTAGVFFGQAQAAGVADLLRASGKSFTKEGIVSGMEALALDVEKAREIGDAMAVHTALLPLALASGVNGDPTLAVRAVVDVARVTRSAAARHRSLRQVCDSIREIMGQLIDWVCSTETIVKWENDEEDDDVNDVDNNANTLRDDGPRAEDSQARRKGRSSSAMDLFNNWLAAVHRLFWRWRRDVLMYLDVDDHSDVMLVKDRVRAWVAEISRPETMGLRLHTLRWHRNQRLIADGREEFLISGRATEKRLRSLSAWLQCLELSLAWDAAKICDRVHRLHLAGINTGDATKTTGPASGLKRPERKSNLPPSLGQNGAFTLPTSTTLLQLQRAYLETMKFSVTDANGTRVDAKSSKRRKEKPRKASDAGRVASTKGGTPHRLAPVTPDSAAAEALDVRLAILQTIREGLVPEALVHETALLRYATENRIDESLHTAIASLITSTLKPNPFPMLTSALAPMSLKQLLWRQVDSEVAVRPISSKPWVKKQERTVEVDRRVPVFVAVSDHQKTGVFGSSTALAGIGVDEVLSLFSMLPLMQQWVRNIIRSWGDEDGGFSSVNIGIDGSGQLPGPCAHHRVASEIAVMIMCTFDYHEETAVTPEEKFAHLAVHFTLEAHKSSPLVVLDLGFRSAPEANIELEEEYDGCFLPNEILDERRQIETELARAAPDEIILRTLVKRPISGDGDRSVWTPLSLHFVILVEGEEGNDCDENAAAKLLYDSVFPTGVAAENVAVQFSALVRRGLRRHHMENLRFLATQRADKMDYLGAYRSVRRLRHMQQPSESDNEGYDEPKSQTSLELGPDEADSEETPHGPRDHGSKSDVAVNAAITRMLKGPAGRLQHARRTLNVLETVLSPTTLPPEALVQLREAKTVRDHAEYAVRYLLDTFAEVPAVRFEGAVESIKRRARLLLDRVMEVTGGETVGKNEGRLHEACRLAQDVSSLLEIVQVAIQTDFHRCCPEMETVLNRIVAEKSNKHRQQTQEVDNRGDFTQNSAKMRRTSLRASFTTGDLGGGLRNK